MTDDTHERDATERNIAKYLTDHPDFFARHHELLADLNLPHDSGKVVSLVERQVSVLRERNVDMRHRLSALLDNARDNDRIFDKSKRLVLALIACKDLSGLVDALYHSFDNDFEIQHSRLILFGDEDTLPASAARVEPIVRARDYIGARLNTSKTVSGGVNAEETRFLFDKDAASIGSSAVATLAYGNPLGVLAIGNQDPNYYSSSMGTLFLAYIGEVLNRLIPSHLSR